jgi:hypothetical protein
MPSPAKSSLCATAHMVYSGAKRNPRRGGLLGWAMQVERFRSNG